MANSSRNKGGRRGPKEDQAGHQRPSHFEEDKGFSRSLRKLDVSSRAQIGSQLREFKKDWRNQERTWKDLNTTWEYKALQGAPKESGVKQIRLSNHRVALMIITEGNRCVRLLDVFKKAGRKNPADIDRVVERARKIRRGEA